MLVESCEFGSSQCLNSIERAGRAHSKCLTCNLAFGNEELSKNHWKPADKRVQHPVLVKRKTKIRLEGAKERALVRRNKNKGRIRVSRIAVKAEKKTEQVLNVVATKNSGRSNKDGDHKALGFITLDTKLQSKRLHPVVKLDELFKVRKDAERAGNPIGGLVLRNKNGQGVVVFSEQDFSTILDRLK